MNCNISAFATQFFSIDNRRVSLHRKHTTPKGVHFVGFDKIFERLDAERQLLDGNVFMREGISWLRLT